MVFLSLILFGFSGCKGDKGNSADAAMNESETKKGEDNNQSELKAEDIQQSGPVTKIKFKEEVYDFGKVMEGKIVEHDYIFTNDGDEPLVLKNVSASCGCTIPLWPRGVIAPGATEKIHASFDTSSRGSVGGQPQTKTITVTGNFEGGTVQLTLKGLVDKKEDANARSQTAQKK
ncbi:MAG: DUF1573 domain-containing protein [Deltaproteobacteria bacterium]